MSSTPVIPEPGLSSQIVAGGVAQDAVDVGPQGGYIVNPYLATDQGLPNSEALYVDPVTAASGEANGTTIALQPGQYYTIIPGQTTKTSVRALSTGHKFTVVVLR